MASNPEVQVDRSKEDRCVLRTKTFSYTIPIMPEQPADPEEPILEVHDDLYAAIEDFHKLRLLMRDRRQSVVRVLNRPEHCAWVSQLSQEMDGLQFKMAG
ncbi:MAG: hypothetical protein Q9199_002731 [Rusavskia elegans]